MAGGFGAPFLQQAADEGGGDGGALEEAALLRTRAFYDIDAEARAVALVGVEVFAGVASAEVVVVAREEDGDGESVAQYVLHEAEGGEEHHVTVEGEHLYPIDAQRLQRRHLLVERHELQGDTFRAGGGGGMAVEGDHHRLHAACRRHLLEAQQYLPVSEVYAVEVAYGGAIARRVWCGGVHERLVWFLQSRR